MLKFLIPPAKEMTIPKTSLPPLISKKGYTIVEALLSLSEEEFAKAYKLNSDASQRERQRLEGILSGSSPTYPAYQLFNGLMYRYIKKDPNSLKKGDYLKKHTFITSTLYGIIPFDFPIAEHRLDFHTKVKVNDQSLKAYWRPDYDQFLSKQDVYISLLSSEFEDVFSTETRNLWISTSFLEEKDGHQKSHSTISKKARGAFLAAAMEANCHSLSDLKSLKFNGFSYNSEQSTKQNFVYIKKEA